MPNMFWAALAASMVAAASPAAAAHAEDAAINRVYGGLAAARAAGDVEEMSAAFAREALLIDQRPGAALSGAELPERLRPMAARLAAENVRIDTAYRIERRSVRGCRRTGSTAHPG